MAAKPTRQLTCKATPAKANKEKLQRWRRSRAAGTPRKVPAPGYFWWLALTNQQPLYHTPGKLQPARPAAKTGRRARRRRKNPAFCPDSTKIQQNPDPCCEKQAGWPAFFRQFAKYISKYLCIFLCNPTLRTALKFGKMRTSNNTLLFSIRLRAALIRRRRVFLRRQGRAPRLKKPGSRPVWPVRVLNPGASGAVPPAAPQ